MTDKTVSLEIELDTNDCCGSGLCAQIAPEAFHLPASGVADVLPGAANTPRDLLLRAARSCPTCCISLIEDGQEADLY